VDEILPLIKNQFDYALAEWPALLVETVNHKSAGSLFQHNIHTGGR
jgi:hypothetical protein